MLNISSGKMVRKWISPIERFFSLEASTGVVLLCCALLALLWANSPWSEVYYKILHYPLGIHLDAFSLSFSLHHWVNDALMVIFFFVVGLEIKRELSVGELATPKKAALPIFAALGGMFIPALFYLIFNPQGVSQMGWGIPMATDIAFAIGVLSLMSKRVPFSLKVFLLALAIVDDLGAILVIAFFYSQEISGRFLAFAGGVIFIIFCAKKVGIKSFLFYIVCGFSLWFFVLQSGVHATVAGVILGLMCPAGRIKNKAQKWESMIALSSSGVPSYKTAKKLTQMISSLHTPAHRLIEELHFYVAWIIMPVFAFFNAGVKLQSGFSFMEFGSHPVSMGILFGLFLGKPIGIVLFSFLAVRLKLAIWPKDFNWRKLTGVGFLAGIGFTMALFISHLSFPTHPELAVYSKLSILLASLLAMLTGITFILFSGSPLESGDESRSLKEE
ncbi:MAG: Na+/H+ antiporter NhaA [Bdellovibrionales bacterium]|nr:Na+/H+ antiporter NhaA [Bdellovibrionales bacterium]